MPQPELKTNRELNLQFLKALLFLLFLTLANFQVFAQSDFARSDALKIESIRIFGLNKTKEVVIWNLMKLSPGDWTDYAKIRRDEESLRNSGYFRSVEIKTLTGNHKGTLVLEVLIKERNYPTPDLGVNYGDEGWESYVGLNSDNFFGYGNQIRSNYIFYGQKLDGLDLRVTAPNVWGEAGYFGMNIFDYREKIYFQVQDSLYLQEIDRDGFEVFVGRQNQKKNRYFFTLKAEYVEPDTFINGSEEINEKVKLEYFDGRVKKYILNEIRKDGKLQKNIAVGLTLLQDERNSRIFPTEGYRLKGNITVSSKVLGSNFSYVKMFFDARFYQKFYKKNTFAFRSSGGWINEDSPFFKKFYLDGINYIRGFPNGGIAPISGGTKFLLFNTEVRAPLPFGKFPKHWITLIGFFDAGKITRNIDEFDGLGLTAGFGFGTRIWVPFLDEIVAADIGFPINDKIRSEKETTKISNASITFSLGFKF